MKEKRKVILIMTDLDNTIYPAKLKSMGEFINTLKEIEDKTKAEVKLCPITGRTASYLLSKMDDFETYLNEAGVKSGLGFGGAELGGIIVHGKDNPYGRTYLYPSEKIEDIQRIKKDVMSSEFSNYFSYDEDAKLTALFVIKPEILRKFKNELRNDTNKVEKLNKRVNELYHKLRKYIEPRCKDGVEVVKGGVIEVKPVEISKDKAIKWMFDQYRKNYDIKGIVYCGDSENDKKAIEYVSKLGMIPGIKSNIFLPSNASEIIKTDNVEKWKKKFEKFGVKSNIKVSKYPIIEGITDLLKKHNVKDELMDKTPILSKTRDDIGLKI